MTSPRYDLWRVSALKPKDVEKFDLLVKQPFQNSGIRQGSDRSVIVYELFRTEEEARTYAIHIKLFGATQVVVTEPEM